MGTVAALMPIAIDIASKTGVSVAFVSGVVVGLSLIHILHGADYY